MVDVRLLVDSEGAGMTDVGAVMGWKSTLRLVHGGSGYNLGSFKPGLSLPTAA